MNKKILNGNYLGLDYKYNTKTNTLNFTKGKLIWDYKGWHAPFLGKFGNHIDNDVPASKYDTSLNVLKIKHVNFGKDVDLSGVHDMRHMFNNCKSLESISGLNHINTHNVTNMSHMFENNRKLKSVDVSNFDTSNVKDTSNMFKGCSSLKRLDLSRWNTKNLKNSSHMFEDNDSLKYINLLRWNTSNVRNMSQMFSGDSSLKHLNVNQLDTHNVRDMSGTFAGCSSLKSLDLGHWNTSKVNTMAQMFNCNYNLKHLNVSKFDTSHVRDMSNMFYGEHKLKNLDVSNFDTHNVKSMDCMFDVSYGLHHIKGLNKFNTKRNKAFGFMFADDNNLNHDDLVKSLKHWDIPKGSDLYGMLQNTQLKNSTEPKKELKNIGSHFMKHDIDAPETKAQQIKHAKIKLEQSKAIAKNAKSVLRKAGVPLKNHKVNNNKHPLKKHKLSHTDKQHHNKKTLTKKQKRERREDFIHNQEWNW